MVEVLSGDGNEKEGKKCNALKDKVGYCECN